MSQLCRILLVLAVIFTASVVVPQPAEALVCTVFHQVAQVCTFGQDGSVIGCNSVTFEDYRCSGGGIGYPFGPPAWFHGGGGGGSSSGSSHGNPLSPSTLSRMSSAKSKAIEALNGNAQCRDLAKDSQALQQILLPSRTNVVDVIQNLTTYRDWSDHETCSTAAAFTTPYTTTTYICKTNFEALSTRQRAAILIHEALHTAGLYEKPHNVNGKLTSQEITQYVFEKCPNL